MAYMLILEGKKKEYLGKALLSKKEICRIGKFYVGFQNRLFLCPVRTAEHQ